MTSKQEPEIHLFIIWEKARHIEAKIIKDIQKKFEIIKIYEIHWSKEHFARNLSRFYGTNLPPGSSKEKHCGTGPFLLVVVKDLKPVYGQHDTSKGPRYVNSNLFLSKSLHREWSGGGHKIHATDTLRETDHDLVMLLGLNTQDFLKEVVGQESTQPIPYKHDLIGANGWVNLTQLFYVLNNSIDYVVLRNFGMLPDKFYADKHGDIDLLVSNFEEAVYIANSKPVFKEQHRVHHKVSIGGADVLFDFRYVSDNYYDKKWEGDILARRVFDKGFYRPDLFNHFYSLLYHGLIHKPELANDYTDSLKLMAKANRSLPRLKSMPASLPQAISSLSRFMVSRDYNYSIPTDKSVFINENNLLMARKFMRRYKLRSPRHVLRKVKSFL